VRIPPFLIIGFDGFGFVISFFQEFVMNHVLMGVSGAIAVGLLAPNSVLAALVSYNFSGGVTSGSLVGETFNGSFSFDDAGFVGSGDEAFNVASLSMFFAGETFTETDGSVAPQVFFFDGELLGIEYQVFVTNPLHPANDFALTTGFIPEDAAFSYNPRSGSGGIGTLNYTLDSSLTTVPEPSTIASLIGLSGLAGLGCRRSRG
jgi:hypothetical protein